MGLRETMKEALDTMELSTVSDAFGGTKQGERGKQFSVSRITSTFLAAAAGEPNEGAAAALIVLRNATTPKEINYIVNTAIRFSFLIELTNLSITSTKMKTRWLPGDIIRTRPGGFANIRAPFCVGQDPRAATFDSCYEIFERFLVGLTESAAHLNVMKSLAEDKNRSLAYEPVLTYANPSASPVHCLSNVEFTGLTDISWLIRHRATIHSVLEKKNIDKIIVKTYLTDRTQTGTEQTNRAKRWETLDGDFQRASLVECWSVERKLLSQLCTFRNFPESIRAEVQLDAHAHANAYRCPITLLELDFEVFRQASEHGVSAFQVGHLHPLKAGGRHNGENVAWVTQDGNRIQGDLSLEQVRQLIVGICSRMQEVGQQGA